jgi:phosphate butyryltransferase
MITKLDELIPLAKKTGKKRLAVAAAEDIYVLNAINKAHKLGLIAPVFIGKKPDILKAALSANININEDDIESTHDFDQACEKAVRLVSEGKADILMKGKVSTNILLKHVVSKEYGLLKSKLLSHLAVFESPQYHKLLGLSDAAMNISPNLNDKKEIIINSVSAFQSLGIDIPKVALLAAVEKVNSKMPATLDAAILKTMGERGQLIKCHIDGPLALDNAISFDAAKQKNITSNVAGDADILIAPNIESGNILYKSLSFLGKSRCAAIILGSKSPIVLTSRADSEENKFLSIVLGVLTSN